MRQAVSIIIGVVFAAGLAVAQGHDNMKEKKVTAEMAFSAPLRVGDVTLPAGNYKVVCDRMTITFTRTTDGRRFVQAPCKGKEMDKRADVTTAATKLDKDGVRYLDKLTLRGSNVEHVFD